ncbi:MBOAT family O-acyltransferase [Roseomonas populi]|uniref:Probable alginate O-acetylase AlgI n=1 Tax=Roseomonas populi TaxID=3121582 RepID=A0ABT1X5M7_9PROT|nr:MBOAT family O-acyltransferase [Roseomonas pecuniae]MCR0982472.1 membrane-bound O-acyltransferase family protein [Roseomonas pecuniae]
MIFASFEFLCLFLPLFFAVYFLTPFRFRNWPILILSWAFYAWWRVDFLLLLMFCTIFTFYTVKAMDRAGPKTRRGTTLFIIGLVGNLGVLAYFKYANFGVGIINDFRGALGYQPIPWVEIILPIGLSFYVLQSVSYLVDIWRGTVPITKKLLDYATYKAIFSQLIAGPIVRYAEIKDELVYRPHTLAQFGLGARRFMTGFTMKVVLADTVALVADAAFALPNPTLIDAWTGAIAYTLQLYFDFAGYSAMAIGLALMIGFHFPENFNHPYLSGSIQAFWQRWHMTLSRFLRDYLYISLGGNRKGAFRTYLNLFLTMVIGGLWHGANWTFIVWGAWHGALLAIHRLFQQAGFRPMPFILGNALTMLAAIIGWVVFRAHDIHNAMTMYGGMIGLNGAPLSDALAWQVTPDQWWTILIAIIVVYLPLLGPRLPFQRPPEAMGAFWRALWVVGPLAGFILGIVLLYSRAAVPFLYFQF